MVYRLTISYRGTGYAGWQRQANALAVQQVVEEALEDLVGAPVRLVGASRTDAGVHARAQSAHLVLSRPFALGGLVHGTNFRLPEDVRILAADAMPPGFHARRAALGKEYLFRLCRTRVVAPIEAPFVVAVPSNLDLEAMRRAMRALPGRHDFTAFAQSDGSHTQPFRRLFAATLDTRGREVRLRFFGEGFLRGMVRALVGTLLEVGSGTRPPEEMAALLEGRAREQAGPSAPAHGLTLERVFYPPAWRPLDSDRNRGLGLW
ncbi:MAG: tRNA pseudouridine(38-40) synthase TruA [Thermoanaerobaculia bacterium]|nr:tRNA pseudouridine(38-40) synthase TruA [Thermoanaerobaculia bacterium]